MGGLHKFMGWKGPILTDSGGFQVFSLSKLRKITEEGVHFRSHIDGSKHFISPEKAMEIENALGADIIMALDECTPGDADHEYAAKSLKMTQKWLERGLKRFDETEPLYGYSQTYFPIVQGCVYPDLRVKAAEHAVKFDREGYAIGGLAVGEPTEVMYAMIEVVNAVLPENKPRYLMGVGTPINILEAIDRGVDMFDCVMPTRNGRNGQIFTSEGTINLRNKKWENDFSPLDPNGVAFVDKQYTKAYVHHLVVCKEMMAAQIASLHNVAFYLWLVGEARKHIIAGDFTPWKQMMVEKLSRRL